MLLKKSVTNDERAIFDSTQGGALVEPWAIASTRSRCSTGRTMPLPDSARSVDSFVLTPAGCRSHGSKRISGLPLSHCEARRVRTLSARSTVGDGARGGGWGGEMVCCEGMRACSVSSTTTPIRRGIYKRAHGNEQD